MINLSTELTKSLQERKRTKYLVIGFPKCGQTSLAEYLHKRFGSENNADRAEIIWKPDGIELFENNGYAELGYRPDRDWETDY